MPEFFMIRVVYGYYFVRSTFKSLTITTEIDKACTYKTIAEAEHDADRLEEHHNGFDIRIVGVSTTISEM